MKKLAYTMMAVGVLVAIVAFNLDVTAGDSGVANLNMMAQRQNLLIVGCVDFLAGIVVLMGALHQPSSMLQAPSTEKASSPRKAVTTFWKQRDTGSKLILASASMLLLSFCLPWETSSVTFESGPYSLPGYMVKASQAAIGLLLWVYPCAVSVARLPVHTEGLKYNGIFATFWIGYLAYNFREVHEAMAAQTPIQMGNGIGFWLGVISTVVLLAGITMLVKCAGRKVQPQSPIASGE